MTAVLATLSSLILVTSVEEAIERFERSWDFYVDLPDCGGDGNCGNAAAQESWHSRIRNKVIVEAIENVRKYFDSPKGRGSTSVADFMGEDERETREIIQRDGYEAMQTVLCEFDRGTAAAEGSA
jgi:hypothetical protein